MLQPSPDNYKSNKYKQFTLFQGRYLKKKNNIMDTIVSNLFTFKIIIRLTTIRRNYGALTVNTLGTKLKKIREH